MKLLYCLVFISLALQQQQKLISYCFSRGTFPSENFYVGHYLFYVGCILFILGRKTPLKMTYAENKLNLTSDFRHVVLNKPQVLSLTYILIILNPKRFESSDFQFVHGSSNKIIFLRLELPRLNVSFHSHWSTQDIIIFMSPL